MAVHKKHPAFAKASAGKEEKPKETKPEETKAASAEGSGEPKTEPVVVSDVVTETIEVIEGQAPQTAKSEKSAESSPTTDPLSDFKEKMVEEELSAFNNAPKKNYMWPILLIFIIVILLLVGVFLYKSETKIGSKVNVATLSPTPTITLEPTKTVDRTKYEIEIQNGSGVSGEASRQETNLTAEGFTISSIGNADSADYTKTIIKAKKEVDKDFIAKLKTVLSNSFTVGETEGLSEDSLVPVVVIIGTKK